MFDTETFDKDLLYLLERASMIKRALPHELAPAPFWREIFNERLLFSQKGRSFEK